MAIYLTGETSGDNTDMMTWSMIFNSTALCAYSAACAYLAFLIFKKKSLSPLAIKSVTAVAILLHSLGIFTLMIHPDGFDLSIYNVSSLMALLINIVILISSLTKPLYNLYVFLFPLSVVSIGLSLLVSPTTPHLIDATPGVHLHILLSITAYCFLTIAALQAILWHWQNQQLKHNRLNGPATLLPPLQTMEKLIFDVLWAGQILLTLGLLIGFFYTSNIFSQHLTHKAVLSIFAWTIFTLLLWGRHTLGWRGNTAVKCVLSGFILLMLGYFGSKLVLEVILVPQ